MTTSARKPFPLPLVLGAACVVALLVVGGWWVFFKGRVSTDNAYIKADITLLSPKVTGYVTEVLVTDNQQVEAGAVLVKIDDADYRARLAQAQGQYTALQGQLAAQEALIAQARANAVKANRDLARARALVPEGAISRKRLDDAQAAAAAANAGLQAATAQTGVLKGQLAQAEAAVQLAQGDVSNTTITAPQAGVVGHRSVQVGQLVRPGSALAYLIPNMVWVEANFKETQVTGMQPGQAATVTVDALPGQKLKGTVQSLSPASGSEFSILPPENATGNFTKVVRRVPVKVVFAAPLPVGVKPGLSAVVTVDVRR